MQNILSEKLEQQVYHNAKYGFEMHIPKDWHTDESGQFDTLVLFMNASVDQEEGNPFTANMNITLESVQNVDLNVYVNAVREMLPKFLQNFKSIEDKTLKVNGTPAHLMSATFMQGVFHLRNLQLLIIKDEQAFIVTGTVLESTWEHYQELIESSLLTFNFVINN